MAKNIIRMDAEKSCFICSALCDDCAYDYCGFKKCEVYCKMKLPYLQQKLNNVRKIME